MKPKNKQSGGRSLKALEQALLDAHAREDKTMLVSLYHEAGLMRESEGDIDAACFYFTHAYVYALETDDALAANLLARLVHYGRDAFPSNQLS